MPSTFAAAASAAAAAKRRRSGGSAAAKVEGMQFAEAVNRGAERAVEEVGRW